MRLNVILLCMGMLAGAVSVVHLTVDAAEKTRSSVTKPDDSHTLLHLRFDEGKGTVAHDDSGNGRYGCITGASWSQGHSGPALSFDGEDDYVDCGQGSAFDFGEDRDFTVEFWMRLAPDVAKKRRFMSVIGKKLRGEAAERGFAIAVHSECIVVMIADGHRMVSLKGCNIADDTWHEVMLTVDRDGDAVLFVDGREVARESVTHLHDISNPNRALRIGDRGYPPHFEGLIDEVRILDCVRVVAH